jgi:hypothetical protein
MPGTAKTLARPPLRPHRPSSTALVRSIDSAAWPGDRLHSRQIVCGPLHAQAPSVWRTLSMPDVVREEPGRLFRNEWTSAGFVAGDDPFMDWFSSMRAEPVHVDQKYFTGLVDNYSMDAVENPALAAAAAQVAAAAVKSVFTR